jgi:tetratricopeptide (TPR) repeat protein
MVRGVLLVLLLATPALAVERNPEPPPGKAGATLSHARAGVRVRAPGGQGHRLGSGAYVGEELVVTAAHVVTCTGRVSVKLPGVDAWLNAAVVHIDDGLDVALLRVRPPKAARRGPLPRAEVEPALGQTVHAWGYTSGYREGRVSNTGESLEVAMESRPGDSGGPVVDEEGRFVGVVSAAGWSSILDWDLTLGHGGPALTAMLEQHEDGRPWTRRQICAPERKAWSLITGVEEGKYTDEQAARLYRLAAGTTTAPRLAAVAWFRAALFSIRAGDDDAAEQDLRASLAAHPTPQALLTLIELHGPGWRERSLLADLESGEAFPGLTGGFRQLALCRLELLLDHLPDAEFRCAEARAAGAPSVLLLETEIAVLMSRRRFAEATDRIDELLRLGPRNDRVLLNRVLALLYQGRIGEARESFGWVRFGRGGQRAAVLRGMLEALDGNHDRAVAVLRRAVGLGTLEDPLLHRLGVGLLEALEGGATEVWIDEGGELRAR